MSARWCVTGGAGYLGSALVASLLDGGDDVVVVDRLLHGGDSLLGFLSSPRFSLVCRDVADASDLDRVFAGASGVIHLAALVGFPACDRAGRDETWRVNVTGTKRVWDAAVAAGVGRVVFASSYSNYGRSVDGAAVTETSPLHPQSTYAESKVEAEQFLMDRAAGPGPAPVGLRLATVFGLSPRPRFDLMLNQFVLDAFLSGRLVVYQEDFNRSFVAVRDVARAIHLVLDAPEHQVRGQIFNVGSEALNTTKRTLVSLVRARWPSLAVEFRDLSLAGDMRSIHVSFEKIRRVLGFETRTTLEDGINELCWALEQRLIADPTSERYRNHPPIVV